MRGMETRVTYHRLKEHVFENGGDLLGLDRNDCSVDVVLRPFFIAAYYFNLCACAESV